MSGEVISPITGTNNVTLVRQIESKEIVTYYRDKFSIDVRYLFRDTPVVSEFKCAETGYRFFYPFELSGDDLFYRQLGKHDWYYLPWKWEHNKATSYIGHTDAVLEVGAGRGGFLEGLKKVCDVAGTGLELNTEAAAEGQARGINLLAEAIEQHALNNPEQYDVVCSFQVLEHISNAGEVIASMICCLKPGGKLIISVPNNQGYLKDNPLPSRILNMPPHHMGLWTYESLRNLEKIFPVKLFDSHLEPLQDVHSDTFQYVRVRKLLLNSTFLTKIYWKLRIHTLVRPVLKHFANYITGHSIMVIYEKTT